MPSFEATATGYTALWLRAKVRPEVLAAAERVARGCVIDKARYQKIEAATGVPWFWIACVHNRESSRNFAGVLHNGEHIIGTGKKTILVPKGRGPFSSWEDAAIDALKLHDLHKIKHWSVARMLYEFERFNGWGYTARKVNSPYVWAGTTLQQPGKYVSDGVWDANAWDKQLGCAAVLRCLCVVDGTVADAVANGLKVQEPQSNVGKVATGGAVVVSGAAAVAEPSLIPWIVGAFAIAAVVGFLVWKFRK